MNDAIAGMLSRYHLRRLEDFTRALREILQEVALLGLWRGKFFDKAAFYGGTALRILYGLNRFSEDLDFSLLEPASSFDLSRFAPALEREIRSFGFDVKVTPRPRGSAIQSAFLKADTLKELVTIEAGPGVLAALPRGKTVKIRLEVDTDPPPGFATETKFLLQPIPFPVRTYTLPDLFAGKMHAVLCRNWKGRVKGRDWFDFVWFVAHHPDLHLSHLEQRMRQSGHWQGNDPLHTPDFDAVLADAIARLDVDQARHEVEPFVPDPAALTVWSREFMQDAATRIRFA